METDSLFFLFYTACVILSGTVIFLCCQIRKQHGNITRIRGLNTELQITIRQFERTNDLLVKECDHFVEKCEYYKASLDRTVEQYQSAVAALSEVSSVLEEWEEPPALEEGVHVGPEWQKVVEITRREGINRPSLALKKKEILK